MPPIHSPPALPARKLTSIPNEAGPALWRGPVAAVWLGRLKKGREIFASCKLVHSPFGKGSKLNHQPLGNPRALVNLVRCNRATHLGVAPFLTTTAIWFQSLRSKARDPLLESNREATSFPTRLPGTWTRALGSCQAGRNAGWIRFVSNGGSPRKFVSVPSFLSSQPKKSTSNSRPKNSTPPPHQKKSEHPPPRKQPPPKTKKHKKQRTPPPPNNKKVGASGLLVRVASEGLLPKALGSDRKRCLVFFGACWCRVFCCSSFLMGGKHGGGGENRVTSFG